MTLCKSTQQIIDALAEENTKLQQDVSATFQRAEAAEAENKKLLARVRNLENANRNAWINRNRFAAAINEIGHDVLGSTVENCSEQAVVREVKAKIEQLTAQVAVCVQALKKSDRACADLSRVVRDFLPGRFMADLALAAEAFDAKQKALANLPAAARELIERVKLIDRCSCYFAGPGRGDCLHFVGVPAELNKDTTDEYGKPHGWCWFCWNRQLIAQTEAERDRLRAKCAPVEALLADCTMPLVVYKDSIRGDMCMKDSKHQWVSMKAMTDAINGFAGVQP